MPLKSTVLLLALLSAGASAQTEQGLQSQARPYGLDIASPVYQRGSDAASVAYSATWYPTLRDYLDIGFLPGQDSPFIAYDPSNLTLTFDADVRVYGAFSAADHLNTLGYATTGGSPESPGARLIFPNAFLADRGPKYDTPAAHGDFVKLGAVTAGSKLDFFLIADTISHEDDVSVDFGNGSHYVSTDRSLNSDGLSHAVAFAYPGSPYLYIAFEESLGTGDERNFRDLFIAIDMGAANIANLAKAGAVAAPEPTLAASGLLTGVFMLGLSRRRQIRH